MGQNVTYLSYQEFTLKIEEAVQCIMNEKKCVKSSVTPNVMTEAVKEYLAKDTPVLFFAYMALGNPVHFVFRWRTIIKLSERKAILNGDIVFRGKEFLGNIVIDLLNKEVLYKDIFDKKQYSLVLDNRSAKEWKEIINELNNIKGKNEQE